MITRFQAGIGWKHNIPKNKSDAKTVKTIGKAIHKPSSVVIIIEIRQLKAIFPPRG